MLRLGKRSLKDKRKVSAALVYLCKQGLIFNMRLSSNTYFASQQWLRRLAGKHLAA